MASEKILVVDDEQSMTQFMSIVLRKEGYEVTAVSSGRDALERVKAANFDIVITDIKMPGMDGIQLLNQIKKHDPSLPVVIMTAYASQQSAIDAVHPRHLDVRDDDVRAAASLGNDEPWEPADAPDAAE